MLRLVQVIVRVSVQVNVQVKGSWHELHAQKDRGSQLALPSLSASLGSLRRSGKAN